MRGHVRQRNAAQQRAPDTYSYAYTPILDSFRKKQGLGSVETGGEGISDFSETFTRRSGKYIGGKEEDFSEFYSKILMIDVKMIKDRLRSPEIHSENGA